MVSSSRQTLPGQERISPRASGVTALPIEMPSMTKASVRTQFGIPSGRPDSADAATASMEPVSHGAGASSHASSQPPAPPSAKVSITLPRTITLRDQEFRPGPGGEPGTAGLFLIEGDMVMALLPKTVSAPSGSADPQAFPGRHG